MKPKFSFLNIILIIWLLLNIIIIIYQGNRPIVKIISNEEKVKNNNFISMMLESEAGTGMYEESKDASFVQEGYVFNAKLSKCENGSKISFEDGKVKVIADKSDKCYVYLDKDNIASLCRGQNMSECFTQNYQKDSALIYHDGKADYDGMENYELEAEDLSYRYTGTNDVVNNYVCFNSNDEVCLEDNLYRIIGFFQNEEGNYEAKLIKATEASTKHLGTNGAYCGTDDNNTIRYCWNTSNGDASKPLWAESNLNNINLNGYYLNSYLNSIWQNYINSHKWITANNSNLLDEKHPSRLNARELYNIDNNKEIATVDAKIGLMYISDYFYAAENKYWNSCGNDGEGHLCNVDPNITFRNIDWLYPKYWELVMYPQQGVLFAFGGYIIYDKVSYIYTVRPAFYLKPTINLISGNGTKEKPYRIAMN